MVPAANIRNLVLREDVTEAVERGEFHVYAVDTIDDALELFTGAAMGQPDADGVYPTDMAYGRVQSQLEVFDRALTERSRGEII